MSMRIKVPSGYMEPYRLVAPLNTRLVTRPWTQDEIQLVMNHAKNKLSPDEIAKKLNRTVADIKSKLKAIAADMYLKKKLPYNEIHAATGVEKNTFILSPSKFKHETIIQEPVERKVLDVSIYDFPGDIEENIQMINVDIRDGVDEMFVTVSVESPFSVKSLCEQISTPIFTAITRISKQIADISQTQHLFPHHAYKVSEEELSEKQFEHA